MTKTSFFVDELAGEHEAWKVDHKAAMASFDVADTVKRGVGLFFLIRMGDESWTKKVQSGVEKFDAKRVKEIRKAYEWWLKPTGTVMDALNKAEISFSIENAEVFRRCIATARHVLLLDEAELVDSMRQSERGEVESFNPEVLGGLPDQSNATGGEKHAVAPKPSRRKGNRDAA